MNRYSANRDSARAVAGRVAQSPRLSYVLWSGLIAAAAAYMAVKPCPTVTPPVRPYNALPSLDYGSIRWGRASRPTLTPPRRSIQ